MKYRYRFAIGEQVVYLGFPQQTSEVFGVSGNAIVLKRRNGEYHLISISNPYQDASCVKEDELGRCVQFLIDEGTKLQPYFGITRITKEEH